jgi:hypothetical protein
MDRLSTEAEQGQARATLRLRRAFCAGKRPFDDFVYAGARGGSPHRQRNEKQDHQRSIAHMMVHGMPYPANQGSPAHARCARGRMNLSIG